MIYLHTLDERSSSGTTEIAQGVIAASIRAFEAFCKSDQADQFSVSPSAEKLQGLNLPQRGRAFGLALGTYR